MDGCWHESFRYFMIPHITGEKFELEKLKEVLDPRKQGYATAINTINYLATHDRQRLLRELGDRGIFDKPAFARAKLAAVLLITAMGIPMLWMGEEFGEYQAKSKSVTQPQPISWSLLANDQNRDLFEYYKKLIALRRQTPSLQNGNIEFFHENADTKLLAFHRCYEWGSSVVVVANLSDQNLNKYHIPNFPTANSWQDWFTKDEVKLKGNGIVTDLPAYTAKILISQ
jgi:1,4-alpha-glucan branching enzyme